LEPELEAAAAGEAAPAAAAAATAAGDAVFDMAVAAGVQRNSGASREIGRLLTGRG
jgi:hypothetical protein